MANHLGFDPIGDDDDDTSPICANCGVSALAPDVSMGDQSVCENPECEMFGSPISVDDSEHDDR